MNYRTFALLWWTLTAVLSAAGVILVLHYTPTEATMGPVQKLFYLHMPSAISTFLAALLCFIASIGYLTQRQSRWDDLAAAGAVGAVFFCSIVLATGMIWGHHAWGDWWTWSPRLTFSLVLWLLYVVYLVIRTSIESSQRRALVSAIYGVIAFLDVPLVYLSVRLMPDIHPTSVQLAPEMKRTLAFCFIPVLMAAAGMVTHLYRRNSARRPADAEARGFAV
jgi:heme exporter protein C